MSSANYPAELLYHPEHDWARVDGTTAELGITWYAQDLLGEIVHVEPPTTGTTVTRGEPYAEIESVKSVSDVIAPLSGEIIEVNARLADDPAALNRDPYGAGWLARVRLSDPQEARQLLSAARYREGLA